MFCPEVPPKINHYPKVTLHTHCLRLPIRSRNHFNCIRGQRSGAANKNDTSSWALGGWILGRPACVDHNQSRSWTIITTCVVAELYTETSGYILCCFYHKDYLMCTETSGNIIDNHWGWKRVCKNKHVWKPSHCCFTCAISQTETRDKQCCKNISDCGYVNIEFV